MFRALPSVGVIIAVGFAVRSGDTLYAARSVGSIVTVCPVRSVGTYLALRSVGTTAGVCFAVSTLLENESGIFPFGYVGTTTFAVFSWRSVGIFCSCSQCHQSCSTSRDFRR